MDYFILGPVFTGCVIFIVGLFVFLCSQRSKINYIFCALCLSLVIWLASYSCMYLTDDPKKALFFARFGFIGGLFIPAVSLNFVTEFLKQGNKKIVKLFYFLIIPGFFLSRTDLVYKSVKNYPFGFYPVAGKLFPVFLILTAIPLTYGITLLFKNLNNKNYADFKKMQTKYLLFAASFGVIGMVDYLAVYPQLKIFPSGFLWVLLFIITMAIAILKHSLMNIQLVFTRVGLFFAVYIPVLGIPMAYGFVIQNWFYVSLYLCLTASAGPVILRKSLKRVEESLFKEKEHFYEASIRDALTDVYNRDYFEKYFSKIVHNSYIKHQSLSLIFIDVDNLKMVNDNYGHQAGDLLLEHFANMLKGISRKDDKIIRYGGDEFVVIMSGVILGVAEGIAHRIKRKSLETQLEFAQKDQAAVFEYTLSLGVAQLQYKESHKDFLRRADKACYQAKESGRNRVVVSQPQNKSMVRPSF